MSSVYEDVCKSLEDSHLEKLVYSSVPANATIIDKLVESFQNAWPLQESILHEPDDKNPLGRWQRVLRELIETDGRKVLTLSHDQGVRQREIEHIEENWKNKHRDEFTRLLLEMLAGYAVPFLPDDPPKKFQELKLRILVVDNKPKEILRYTMLLPPQLGFFFWKNAEWYVLSGVDELAGFENALYDLKSIELEQRRLSVNKWNLATGAPGEAIQLDCQNIDLVLQDQYLGTVDGTADGEKLPDGSRLAEHYIDIMPQALVFLTTGTDIAELAALGEMRFVDRAISKTRLAALPWYYYLAFNEILGAMFWDSWLGAPNTEPEPGQIYSRWTLRRLLGSIRTWMKEPDILWHGQTCAELVDHSQPHISDMWKMANDILGARLPGSGDLFCNTKTNLTHEERILLALGIWTHDIGHRGDDHKVDSSSIREIHSSISEALLLSNRKAFGLEWLDKLCPSDCQCGDKKSATPKTTVAVNKNEVGGELGNGNARNKESDDRRHLRNLLPPSTEHKLCLLRLTGIVSKHHQSSAPLSDDKLPNLITGMKSLHDYSRFGLGADGKQIEDSIAQWCDDDEDLDWIVRDIRCLEDFTKYSPTTIDLMKVTGLLRFLDAIDLDRCRTGTRYKIETHADYRAKREVFCEKECERLIRVLQDSPQGSPAYIHAFERYIELKSYLEQIIRNQEPHLWRQEIVERRQINFPKSDSKNRLHITFYVREASLGIKQYWDKAGADWEIELAEYIKNLQEKANKDGNSSSTLISTLQTLKGGGNPASQYACWTMNFLNDVILPELEGQHSSGLQHPLETALGLSRICIGVKYPISGISLDISLKEILDFLGKGNNS